jgi:hypothetical protein
MVLRTRIAPTKTYAMEVWQPPLPRGRAARRRPDLVDDVQHAARRLAMGVHAGKHKRAWAREASVKRDMIDADCSALPAQRECTMAHARYAKRAWVADEGAAQRLRAPPNVSACHGSPVDYMVAVIRSGLPRTHAWRR